MKNAPTGLIWKLRSLMFLQFAIWGTWYMTIGAYMAEKGIADSIGWTYTVGPLAAIISPFTIGMLADRFFQTQKVLSVLFLFSGLFIACAPNMAEQQDGTLFNTFIFLHMICFMPSLGLSASLSFTHLKEAANDFPLVRVWGTLGWIASASAVSLSFIGEKSSTQLYLAAVYSIILSLVCMKLPKTIAPKKGQQISLREVFFLDAWKLLKDRNIFIFMISAFLICIPLAAFYLYLQPQMMALGVEKVGFYKSFGQWSEVGFMLLMPIFFRKLGIKNMLIIGMAAWALRYLLFYLGASQETFHFIMMGILLHGICYDFFFVIGHIYVDEVTQPAIRAQAQSMFIFFTQGLGLAVGAKIAEHLFNKNLNSWDYAVSETSLHTGWPQFWLILSILALAVTAFFILSFRKPKTKTEVALG